jgi:protein O-mannosyl-transferase
MAIGYYALHMGSKLTKNKAGSLKREAGISWPALAGIAVGLIVLTAIAYSALGQNGFVFYDDNNYIYENYHVQQGLTLDNVKWAFTSFEASNWHPLTWLSHMLDVQMFGLKPAGHHFVNLAWHMLNTLVLFGLLRYMTGRFWASAFVAAIFALHPLHVESVAWASERKDVLSTFFWLATMLAYARYVRQPGKARYLLVLVLFSLGLMVKPMLVTLPVVLLILDYWPLERFSRKSVTMLVFEKLPMLAMAGASAAVTVMAQQTAIIELAHASIATRLTNAAVSCCLYLWQAIWPIGLAAFYPHPQRALYSSAAAGLLLLAAITIACIGPGRRQKYLIAGWMWYLITLVPVIGFVQVGDQGHADRYTYIPLIGVFVMVAWGVGDLIAKRPGFRSVATATGVAVLVAASILTWVQVGHWKNDISLFSHATQVVKGNYIMKMKLADAFLVEKRYNDALVEAEESLLIKPMGHTYAVIGAIYQSKRDLQKAYECYQQALSMNPDIKSAMLNLGGVLLDLGRYGESEQYLQKALAIDPYWADAYSLLGQAQAGSGRLDEARNSLLKAISLKPNTAQEHFVLGGIYARKGDFTAAVNEYQNSNAIQKDSITLSNMAGCLATMGRRDEAARAYEESLAMDPKNPEVYYNFAILLDDLGRKAEAKDRIRAAMSLAPENAEIKEFYRKLSGGGQ